ncbi:ankyrin repeat domain-containing protein [Cytobacillus luteolus]|nr:ankyrin repeat domain-containing protein [Cytobacillus luteolus]MBP1942947.1 ankyrin repeat protein [Cytobacillus luteolus]
MTISGCTKLDKLNKNQTEELFTAVEEADLEQVKILTEENIDLESKNDSGETVFIMSLKYGLHDIANLLLESGAKSNYEISEQNPIPALSLSISTTPDIKDTVDSASLDLIDQLLNNVEVDQKDMTGSTALHYASRKGSAHVVNKLLDAGADPTITNSLAETPLLLASARGHSEVVKALIEKGSNVNEIDSNGWSPLMLAISNDHIEAALSLIKKEANVNYQTQNEGYTALMIASEYGYQESVRILLENGAEKSLKDNLGEQAIDKAKKWNHDEIVSYLNGEK